jgi:two-component system, OmpR family, sensor histidine kinase KdpD
LTAEEIDLACAVHADLSAVEMHLLLDRSQATQFLPLEASNGAVGVLAIRMAAPVSQRRAEFWRLAQAFAAQAGLAIERVRFAEAARRAHMLEAAERLQTALLNSISHDLRTPLVAITGALTMLRDGDTEIDSEARRRLISDACAEADHLNRLVGHLLEMARIEAGAMHLTLEPCDVQDAVGTALEQTADRLVGHELRTRLPADLPLVSMDFVLIVQVLVNLIDNAAKYSRDGAAIEISAAIEEGMLRLDVADQGTGVPADDLARVFDKFYRVHRPDAVAGSGLGLAICKGVVEAHGGAIAAANRIGGGTVITVTLPLMQDATMAAEERP